MSYIQVDSRGCGAGKTRNSIIPRIRKNIKNRIRTLVIVPSIQLQQEYQKYFMSDEFTVINSSNKDEGKIFNQYQQADTPVVCMTHEGFLRTPGLEKTNWDLVIDEAFNPYYSQVINNSDRVRALVDFSNIVSWKDSNVNQLTEKPKTKLQPFFELEFDTSLEANTINKTLWRNLTSPNFRIWATWTSGHNLMHNSRETSTVQLEVNPELLRGWSSVWIAAAVFEKTLMGMWLKSNNIDFDIVHKFKSHRVPIRVHIPENEFSWSKNYRMKHPEIEQIFKKYCDVHRSGRLIYNNNDDSSVVFEFGKKITHNAHGVNEYKHLTDYAFLSAIKPNPHFNNFLFDRTGSDPKELEFAFAGYMAYQLVMRTALRDPDNTTPVNIFFLDTTQVLGILDLFDFDPNKDICYITEIQGNKKTSTRSKRTQTTKIRKTPMSNAEKQKLYRERKKNANGH